MIDDSTHLTLWHYSTIDSIKSILSSMRFRVFHYADMEDKLEIKYPVRLLELYWKRHCKNQTLQWKSDFLNVLKNGELPLYLWCFSTSDNGNYIVENIIKHRKGSEWQCWGGICLNIQASCFRKTSNDCRWFDFCSYESVDVGKRVAELAFLIENQHNAVQQYSILHDLLRKGTNVEIAQELYPIKRKTRKPENEFRVAYIPHENQPAKINGRRYFEVSLDPIKQCLTSIAVGGQNIDCNFDEINRIVNDNGLSATVIKSYPDEKQGAS